MLTKFKQALPCHLDAFMVHGALHHVELAKLDICFVENVGNLVCPASYDVGIIKYRLSFCA